jgi:hypothetical protein
MAPTQVKTPPVLACLENTIARLPPTPNPPPITEINFKTKYFVEGTEHWTDIKTQLEAKIFEVLARGSMPCNGPCSACDTPYPTISTIDTGESCFLAASTTDSKVSQCFVLETQLKILVAHDLDSPLAEFSGYVALEEAIYDGTFDNITGLIWIQYLEPYPLNPPLGDDDDNVVGDDNGGAGTFAPLQSPEISSVSPWTLGAVVAMSIGGIAALVVWARNRRVRNERHLQLVEDVSAGSSTNRA